MSKKRVIFIIVICAVLFAACCITGYIILKEHITNAEKRGFVTECKDFLTHNASFNLTYGEIINLETEDEYPPHKIVDEGKTAYYMTFCCETQKAIFQVRVFHVYDGDWSHRYQVNSDTINWK